MSKHLFDQPGICARERQGETASNDVIEQTEMRKCLDRQAFEMMIQEFNGQG